MPSDPKYRQAAYEAAREKRIVARIARQRNAKKDPGVMVKANGHVVPRRERVVQCEACPVIFIAVMTSKPHRFCAACRAVRQKLRDAGRAR